MRAPVEVEFDLKSDTELFAHSLGRESLSMPDRTWFDFQNLSTYF